MMHIFPCNGCPLRDGCEQREEFRARAKAAKCTSVRFRCEKLRNEMRPGRRVIITAPREVCDPEASNYYGEWTPKFGGMEQIPATITHTKSYRFLSTVDAEPVREWDDKTRFRKWQAHRKIVRFLDEPDAEVCAMGQVVRDGFCDRSNGFYTGERCERKDYREQGLCHCGKKRWRGVAMQNGLHALVTGDGK